MSSTTEAAQRAVYTDETRSSVPKPTAKQVYRAAHLMADMLGLSWPSNRREASELIARLSEHAIAAQAPTDAPAF